MYVLGKGNLKTRKTRRQVDMQSQSQNQTHLPYKIPSQPSPIIHRKFITEFNTLLIGDHKPWLRLLGSLFVFVSFFLFHGISAQIEQVTSQVGTGYQHRRLERQQRSQPTECQLERLNALEPSRRIQSEAGETEIWDENDEQFRCAGVVVLRHTIRQRGLLLPVYANTPKLVYVDQGRGFHGAAIPGCPETYQSSGSQSREYYSREHGQGPRDEHQKVRRIREGDVIALPTGVSDWFYNNGDSDLVLIVLMDTASATNQLDQDFRKFFLAGNPQSELQSQRSESEESRWWSRVKIWGRRRGQRDQYRNIFNGFNDRILAEAFNIDTELARKLKNQNDMRGIIVRVRRELDLVIPQQSQEEEEREQEYFSRRRSTYNGIEETFCTARLKQNINKPSHADFFNPNAGRITTVTSHDLPVLQLLQLSAQKGVLYRNAMMAPHYNRNAHCICYVTRGSGRIQVVGDDGQKVFDGHVREGQVFTAPQNFAVVKQAGNEGLEWIAFKTHENAQTEQLAGRLSAMKAIPEEVIANSFQISREEARRLKYSRKESTLFTPFQSHYRKY